MSTDKQTKAEFDAIAKAFPGATPNQEEDSSWMWEVHGIVFTVNESAAGWKLDVDDGSMFGVHHRTYKTLAAALKKATQLAALIDPQADDTE